MTENARFKQGYRRTLRLALAISLALHLAGLFLLPPRTSRADPPPEDPGPELVDVEALVLPPDPPEPPRRPVIPREAIVEDVAEETIPDTDYDPAGAAPPPLPRPVARADFRVYDSPPRPERTVLPVYPSIAREAGIEGAVVLLVTVDERGRVVRASVLSSDTVVLERAALDAVRLWTFRPAEQSGIPVRAAVRLRLVFTLR